MKYLVVPKCTDLERIWSEYLALAEDKYRAYSYQREVERRAGRDEYRVQLSGSDHDQVSLLCTYFPAFDTRADAHSHLQSIDADDRAFYTVEFYATSDEENTFRRRERDRFTDGKYVRVAWANEINPSAKYADAIGYHFPHISLECPDMIAYTKSLEHGIMDRQTRVKPGRYLQEFYAETMTPEQIRTYAAGCSAEHTTLKITTDRKIIRRVFENGPRSCMGGHSEHCEPFYDRDVWPTEVYAGPDLAIAYYGHEDRASARCVVWPSRKIHSRIYGCEETMNILLSKEGYHSGSIVGALILKIPYNGSRGSVVMPYLDGADYAIDCGDRKHLRIERELSDGDEYYSSTTDGYSDCHTYTYTEDRCTSTCDHCDSEYDSDDEGADGLCQSCYDDRWSCDSCGETSYSPDDQFVSNGRSYCESCHDGLHTNCAADGCSNRWIESDLLRSVRQARQSRGIAHYCRECADGHEYCSTCDDLYSDDHSECPSCADTTETE